MKKLIFVGAWPKPYGGVSEFCRRLLGKNIENIYMSILRCDDPIKLDGDGKKILCAGKIKFLCTVLFYKIIHREKFFHLNFSTPNAMFFLWMLPNINNNIITLHNGELNFHGNPFLRKIQINVLRRAKALIALNVDQERVYRYLGGNRVLKISSYLAPSGIKAAHIKKNYDIFSSGFCDDIYQLEWVVDYAEKNHKKLCLVLYGEIKIKLMNYIKNKKKSDVLIDLHTNIDPDSFLKLLSESFILARPNLVDSVGIAVCDGAYLGLTVVASNVCRRPTGTYLFDPLDKADFYKSMNLAFSESRSCDSDQVLVDFDAYRGLHEFYENLS